MASLKNPAKSQDKRKQFGGFHLYHPKVFIAGDLKFPAMLRLQDFTGTHRVRGHRHRPADFGRGKTGRQFQGLREKAIAKKHGDFVPPIGCQSELTATDFRFIHYIVVDQGGQVDHFDDHRGIDVGVAGFADRVGGQGQQGGAQMFAAAVERIARVGNNLRVEIIDLLEQTLCDRLEKWLQRFHNVFPGTVRVALERVSRFCSRHLWFNGQHSCAIYV